MEVCENESDCEEDKGKINIVGTTTTTYLLRENWHRHFKVDKRKAKIQNW